VKVLFDTNVLTAAFVPQHPNHGACRPWFQRAKVGELQGYVSLHTVAELYSVLTKLPLAEKITPTAAQGIILPSLEGFVKVRLAIWIMKRSVLPTVSPIGDSRGFDRI
jgi:predicted nucleic acid-binding protein